MRCLRGILPVSFLTFLAAAAVFFLTDGMRSTKSLQSLWLKMDPNNGTAITSSVHSQDKSWETDFAFLMLSGTTTAQTRLPVILLTWLSSFKQFVVVGAEENSVGHVFVHSGKDLVYDSIQRKYAQIKADTTATSPGPAANSGIRGGEAETGKRRRGMLVSHSSGRATKQSSGGRQLLGAGTLNRYKGIPAWTFVDQEFPGAKYYICVDDDTYYFLGVLRRIARHWNSSQSFISGAPYGVGTLENPVTGRKFNETGFPHGGEGIIMSRAALTKFLSVSKDDCLEIVDAVVHNDVGTMLCANIAGIPFKPEALKRTLAMNNPPEGWPSEDPCRPILSVHHLNQPQMQALYLADQVTGGSVTFVDVWKAISLSLPAMADPLAVWLAAGQCAQPTLPDSLTERGSQANSIQACQAECVDNNFCAAFCYDELANSCSLHAVVGNAAEGNCTSGIVTGRFACF